MADAPVAFLVLTLAVLAANVQGQDDEFYDEKRGISALARNGDLPSYQSDYKRFAHPMTWRRLEEEKRVAHPMSRQTPRADKRFAHPLATQWMAARDAEEQAERQLIDEILDEALQNLEKRMGVSALARDNSLPGKRNIAAMARDGYLTQHTRQPSEDDLISDEEEAVDDVSADKRNLAALARNFNMPAGGGKRNVASRARSLSRYAAVKRNLASLLRSRNTRQPYAYARLSGIRDNEIDDDVLEKRNIQALLKTMRPTGQTDESKRHLSSVLGGKRRKRSALHDPMEVDGSGAEYPAISYEYEYEEAGAPVHEDKRFLEPEVLSEDAAGEIQLQKRNVASLARLGWLPAPLRY